MNKSFQNYLVENSVLDNDSNKINKIYFDKFNGEFLIKVNTGGYINNGYICGFEN